MSEIRTKEDAIIKALKTSEALSHIRKRSITSFNGETEDAILQNISRLPMLFVHFRGIELVTEVDMGGRESVWNEYSWEIAILTKHFRSESDARRNRDGAYEIIDDVRTAIDGQRMGLESCCPFEINEISFAGNINKPSVVSYSIVGSWRFLTDVDV